MTPTSAVTTTARATARATPAGTTAATEPWETAMQELEEHLRQIPFWKDLPEEEK